MSFTDPIGDMLTRIRNASNARHEKCPGPHVPAQGPHRRGPARRRASSRTSSSTRTGPRAPSPSSSSTARDREPAISDIKRVSKPGLRRYVPTDSIPRVLNGMGIAILSTSKGVMVDREARKQKVGGELICTVW